MGFRLLILCVFVERVLLCDGFDLILNSYKNIYFFLYTLFWWGFNEFMVYCFQERRRRRIVLEKEIKGFGAFSLVISTVDCEECE